MTTLTPRPEPAPRNARQAAEQLLAAGHHVHYAAHAEQVCLTGTCRIVPIILDGIAPDPKERP
ncbi:hypothetical protein [Streptomyces griseoloalbus]|uniref:Uncharacterized protein n=1 Tax=Streptomyces griseoloalbus TaxID=67303 RepID=A0A7W8BRZ2_9ACTN|nr:hypothetical protein [Streptomyces albaduncus]MBB5128466.1 hypothetical protein [Streptomyces albaduncus]GGW68100.1 hypothetical protein GCM10010340_52780 [Streptomyces albaduncus]